MPSDSDYHLVPNTNNPEADTLTASSDTMQTDNIRRTDKMAHWIAMGAVSALSAVTYLVVLSNDPASKGWFAFHPLLVTLALSLITYGILTLQPTNKPKTKAEGLSRHTWAIAITAIPCLSLGVLAIWWNKTARGADHFVSWHGKIGILCFFVLILQAILGGGSVWFGGRLFGGTKQAKSLWKYHRALGYTLLTLLLVTIHLGGGWSNWAQHYVPSWIRLLTYAFAPLAIAGSVAVRIRWSKMPIF